MKVQRRSKTLKNAQRYSRTFMNIHKRSENKVQNVASSIIIIKRKLFVFVTNEDNYVIEYLKINFFKKTIR